MTVSGLQRRKIEVLLDGVEQLPTLPGVAHRLLPLVTADSPNRRDIQFLVEADAALSARVVQRAIQLGRPAESIASVDDVFDTVPIDVLAADLLSIEIADRQTTADLHLARLWRHTLATGMAAQIIANRLGTVRPEDALLAGILHDLGQIALGVLMPKAYAEVLAQAESAGVDLMEAERAVLGIDHAILGKRLAQHWGFSYGLQNVIWLHHQAQVPAAGRTGIGALVQIVRLANLITRQQGLSYHPSEQIRESASDAAEQLGLSWAGADQIGYQVASALELNAGPAGLDDDPDIEALWPVLGAANARLGRLCRAGSTRLNELQTQARRADLLMNLNTRLAGCRSARDVLETVATTARDALGTGVVVPYFLGREGDYLEGVRCPASGGIEDHFLYPIGQDTGVESLAPQESGAPAPAVAPVRAERLEAWLFEHQGAALGAGPFYTIPMVVEDRKVGGLVFSLEPAGRNLTVRETGELAALASTAGVALKRVQAEADLTTLSEELAEVNRQLQAAQQDQLQRRNVASMSEMACGAAHEINNPLAIISGRAQQLAAGETEPARRDIFKTIIQQADRISDIIAELQRFAQPATPAFQAVDPLALAQQVAAEFEPKPGQPGAAVHVEAAEPVPAIRVDPDQVAGALKEVIRNAVEACPNGSGGRVQVAVQPVRAEQAVRFVVTDTGPGMEPNIRARAFDPFFCGREAGRHRGLGLPKAYRAVQANGGEMSLESTPGRGTTVRMTFRAAEATPAA